MGSRLKRGAAGIWPAHNSCADERSANLCASGAHSVGFHFTHRIVILITTRRVWGETQASLLPSYLPLQAYLHGDQC